ncbi:glycosyltransferase family 4 protein [Egbenema bharatensis]|uniref:glycosyltransferase family 4 protein n=1 Tax=Egbenema bharatensis TaxID=3463334 RepID=UPI003A8C377A
MKVLMLSSTFPSPPTRGGTQVRTFNLLKYLRQSHHVTLLTLQTPEVTDAEIAALQQSVDELVVFSRPPDRTAGTMGKLARWAEFVGTGTPPNVHLIHLPSAQNWLDQAVGNGKFDVITCEHCVNEVYVRPQWLSQVRTIVNIHSSVYGTCKNLLATGTSEHLWRDRLNLPLLYRYEHRYCQKFSGIVVTTAEDAQQIRRFNPDAEIAVIPNGVDFSHFPYRTQDPGGHRLVFIGAMDNVANIDAARFLSLEIFPAIQQRYPDTTLELVGSRPVPDVKALGEIPGITVTGQVPSMADYLHRATVCLIPMRTGFGIKNKTLEAMAAGVPVVGSDRGLEGLAVDQTNEPLRAWRANQVGEYVEAVDRLFQEPELRIKISQAARQFVEQNYTWESAGRQYEKMVMQGG